MVDIIIPTYNRKQLLEFTLLSVLTQSLSPDLINVIVVDDGSSDSTQDVVENFQDKLRINYFFQDDLGYRVGRARNLGIENSSSDIIMLIDAGVVLSSNCLEKHLALHDTFKYPISVIGYVYGFDNKDSNPDELQLLLNKGLSVDKLISHLDRERKFLDVRENEYAKYNYQIHDLPAPWAFFWTAHVSINRACLANEDAFDTIFEPRYGYEDIDLGYRLYKNCHKIYLERDAKALHYPHRKTCNFEADAMLNSHVFYNKHKDEIIRLFNEHGGTFGFNDFLLKERIQL
jgi:glycosyltransferase involved in cell wall biosynthesis